MVWDPFGTIANALWIGGGQWAGKSTVARILANRYGITAYHYDYHDARGHEDRRIARRVREGEAPFGPDADSIWVHTTPARMAGQTIASFADRFEWVLDDLRGLVSGGPILAEGWGLRPGLVARVTDAPGRMLVMVATPEFRQRQLASLPRAAALGNRVSDPVRAQQNRLARDELVTEDAVRDARQHGVRVLEVDGSQDADATAALVADHFAVHLRRVAG